MNVGERIKQKRIEMSLTQDELAKKVGYKSRSSINKIELSRDLPLPKIEKVAKALDCSPSYLMGWEDKANIIETAKADVMLSNMDNRLKDYALKMSELSKEKQDLVLKMIDELGK
jgi:transcriptional regulator with XRE-family HTH domain